MTTNAERNLANRIAVLGIPFRPTSDEKPETCKKSHKYAIKLRHRNKVHMTPHHGKVYSQGLTRSGF